MLNDSFAFEPEKRAAMRSKSKSLLTKVISGSLLASLVAVAASTAVSAAEEGPTASDVQAVLDNVWILIAAVLVIFMQAGFALV